MILIELFINILSYYFLIGLVFGIYFGLVGAKKLDGKIGNSGIKVKLLLIPGSILLWPILLFKLIRRSK